MSELINKIHVTSSTGLSLNDRFTAMGSVQDAVPQNRGRSRSRQPPLRMDQVVSAASMANVRFLQQLERRHKVQAALKLKRRSMRTTVVRRNAPSMRRANGLRSLRVAPNGRPIKARSTTTIPTMRADLVALAANNGIRKPLRRRNIISNRLGGRSTLGGAAERIAKRRLLRNGNIGEQRRGRSRSRSRARDMNTPNMLRGRSQERGRSRARSRSRGRINAAAAPINTRIPVKARLGVRPGATAKNANNANNNYRRGRSASRSLRGVRDGRIQRRQNGNAARAGVQNAARRNVGRKNQGLAISAARNMAGGRSRSRSRNRISNGNGQMRRASGGNIHNNNNNNQRSVGARGAGQQRQGRNRLSGGRNAYGKQQNQQNRRSRSRQRRNSIGGRNAGKGKSAPVNKDALDKELDQYMATTKTENDMDFLLKN